MKAPIGGLSGKGQEREREAYEVTKICQKNVPYKEQRTEKTTQRGVREAFRKKE